MHVKLQCVKQSGNLYLEVEAGHIYYNQTSALDLSWMWFNGVVLFSIQNMLPRRLIHLLIYIKHRFIL